MKHLGFYFLSLIFVITAHAQNIDELTKKAESGDVPSQFELGTAYDFAIGVSQNLDEAVKWYKEAARVGHPQAQNSLGSLYQAGEGVPLDNEEAFKWYSTAAEQNLPSAINNLAFMYDKGLGVGEDDVKAVSLYKSAAEFGEIRAMVNLGAMYFDGTGVVKDNSEAYMWLDLARFYTQRSTDKNLKWHVRGVLDEMKKAMTRKEIKSGKKRARKWSKARSQ